MAHGKSMSRRSSDYRSGGKIHTKRTGKTKLKGRGGLKGMKAGGAKGALKGAPEVAASTQRKKDNPHGRIEGTAPAARSMAGMQVQAQAQQQGVSGLARPAMPTRPATAGPARPVQPAVQQRPVRGGPFGGSRR